MRQLVPASIRGLTTRGRCFLAAGIACLFSAVVLGEPDLLRVGLLLVLLPLAACVVVSRTRYRLSCTRDLAPRRVPSGQPADVVIKLNNVSRLPTSVLLMEDTLPYALGSRPRFVLDRVEAEGHRTVTYPVRSDVRGRFRIGPLTVRLTDPFGFCELTRAFATSQELIVTPQFTPLPPSALRGDWAGAADHNARSVASTGEDDIGTRAYRRGDDLRKVHWKSTARSGELMVRQEQQPWQSLATVLLDSRADAHFGDGPGSSFEWAVSAVASLGVSLTRHGYGLRVLQDDGRELLPGELGGEDLLLDQLAIVSTSAGRTVEPALRVLRGSDTSSSGLLIAILGQVDARDAAKVAAMPRGRGISVAVLMDAAAWGAPTPRQRSEADVAMREARDLLVRAGWRVVIATHGSTIASVWSEVSPRLRARMAAVR